MNGESSTFEMETKNNFEAITEMRQEINDRLDKIENDDQSDRLVSEISQTRSVIYSVKADLGEFNEKVYLLTRSNEIALKS